MVDENNAMRKAIRYVAGRIEDKWQKRRHSELAIKAEKIAFRISRGAFVMLQNSSKTQRPRRRQQYKVRGRRKTKDIKEAPISQTDFKGFTCETCTFTQSRSRRPEGWGCSPFSTGTSEQKVPTRKVRRNQMPWLLGQRFPLSDRLLSTWPPHPMPLEQYLWSQTAFCNYYSLCHSRQPHWQLPQPTCKRSHAQLQIISKSIAR